MNILFYNEEQILFSNLTGTFYSMLYILYKLTPVF